MSQGSQQSRAGAAGLFDVFIHLHVLHAASREALSAEQLIEFLGRRRYKVDSRAMSALLRRFERRNWLRVQKARNGSVRLFRTTGEGKKALQKSQPLVSAIFREIAIMPAPKSTPGTGARGKSPHGRQE